MRIAAYSLGFMDPFIGEVSSGCDLMWILTSSSLPENGNWIGGVGDVILVVTNVAVGSGHAWRANGTCDSDGPSESCRMFVPKP